MGAKVCIENKTDIPVAVLLQQVSVRYWARVPPQRKVIWHPDHLRIHRGLYTVRAIDASSQTFEDPNMKKENAKAVGSGVLMGVGAATFMAGLALIIVPGLGVVLTGIGGALAFAGGAGATGAGVAAALNKSAAVKHGVHIGECKIIVDSETEDGIMKLQLQKVDYDEDDENASNTTIMTKEQEISATQNVESLKLDGSSFSCFSGDFKNVCKRYLDTLNIPDIHLDRSYDKCFCESCCVSRKESDSFVAAGSRFAVPRECMKFGVKLPPQAIEKDIFNNWHGCYHGTSPESIIKILEVGRLLKPGDYDPEGSLRVPGRGRFQQHNAPRGHNVNQYFFTPSLLYTMYGNLYANANTYEDSVTREKYYVRTMLQVRVMPDAYKKGPQTMGATEEIDGVIPNEEIEWSTKREGVHFIYGILIHMTVADTIEIEN